MRFKLLCFIVPLKVAFVITLQYLTIDISDTPWVSWHSHSCSRGWKVAPLRVGMLFGQLKPNHQFIARVGFGGLFGTEANMERGKEHPQKPGDPCPRLCFCHNYRSTNLGFRILTGKGKRFDSMTSQILSNAKTMGLDNEWSAWRTESQSWPWPGWVLLLDWVNALNLGTPFCSLPQQTLYLELMHEWMTNGSLPFFVDWI